MFSLHRMNVVDIGVQLTGKKSAYVLHRAKDNYKKNSAKILKILCQASHKKDNYCTIPLIEVLRVVKFIETEWSGGPQGLE